MKVSECFFSLQGEGATLGRRALFIRLPKCNLACGTGKLIEQGKASWICDTQEVMKTSIEMSTDDIINKIKSYGEAIFQSILLGYTHIVFTGGEPALEEYREPIIAFIKELSAQSLTFQREEIKAAIGLPMIEIETNGTQYTGMNSFYNQFNFVNCSPKLSNSGMVKDVRIVPFALIEISKHSYSTFKFVINQESDWEEAKRDFLDTNYINVPADRIFLMPAGDTRDKVIESSKVVWEICKQYGLIMTTRLHILAFDKKVGV